MSFRLGQEAVVRAVLDGRDVLAVMPTGSGKSLGFQLPAVLLPGSTIAAAVAPVARTDLADSAIGASRRVRRNRTDDRSSLRESGRIPAQIAV